MQIAKDKVVTFDYTLTDNDGTVMDSSEGGEPLAYIHGIGNIVPGLETALEGRKPGESFKVTIPPDRAYGERDESLAQNVPLSFFESAGELEVGMRVRVESEAGTRPFTIVGIGPEAVTLDGNHPLAGVTLNFDVTVVDVRDATAEELSHGHAHGPQGHP